ncbi:hypothetical protein LRAMOSA02595 [Lichtheimia ramosa]|uniref:Uncharacterized protein n=1 Tax=Lichtheimia ramosa TaxID=688394 RepID=A0A077WS47_9FUNG|nr:hypothetical protein LRAMOSA02595 [Lichtheimia ramosa]
MPFKIANHGGRYLYVDDDNQIQADHNYDLSRSASDLASKGTVFDTDKQHQLVTNKGPVKYNMGGTPMDLQLEQINADEYVIRTSHGKHYLFSGLESIRVEDQVGPMGIFTVVNE